MREFEPKAKSVYRTLIGKVGKEFDDLAHLLFPRASAFEFPLQTKHPVGKPTGCLKSDRKISAVYLGLKSRRIYLSNCASVMAKTLYSRALSWSLSLRSPAMRTSTPGLSFSRTMPPV
jgi:hypothetical protein